MRVCAVEMARLLYHLLKVAWAFDPRHGGMDETRRLKGWARADQHASIVCQQANLHARYAPLRTRIPKPRSLAVIILCLLCSHSSLGFDIEEGNYAEPR